MNLDMVLQASSWKLPWISRVGCAVLVDVLLKQVFLLAEEVLTQPTQGELKAVYCDYAPLNCILLFDKRAVLIHLQGNQH